MLHLGLIPGDGFGWGTIGNELPKALAMLTDVSLLDPGLSITRDPTGPWKGVQGDVFQAATDHRLLPTFKVRGQRNYAFLVFINFLPEQAKKNAQFFTLLFSASEWCTEQLRELDVRNVQTLTQGVDVDFYFPKPAKHVRSREKFVLFSGGKFSFQKGQDLVIKAFKHLQEKYDDMVLSCAWFNGWDFDVQTMARSPHIETRLGSGDVTQKIRATLAANGIDMSRAVVHPRLSPEEMRQAYRDSDLGVFPNRCEGATNLVLMEYLACGKPAVVAYNTGHRDIVDAESALLLENFSSCPIVHRDVQVADWYESDFDELIAKIEEAYRERDRLAAIGDSARKAMNEFTWKAMARNIVRAM